MNGTGWNKDFFTDNRLQDFATDFKLHFSFQHHHQFIDGMGVVFPDLTRWVSPDIATETA